MRLFGTTKRTMVVDLDAVLKSKGVRGRAQPRQQLQILRLLSRMGQREKVNVTAVFVSEPLSKAPHNTVFDGVRVRYAKSDDDMKPQLLAGVKQAGGSAVFVTEDVAMENKVIRSGKDTLRVSTFRKLLDEGNEPIINKPVKETRGNKRSNGRDNRERGPRSNRKPDRPAKKQQQVDRKSQAQDEISQMIDLVE